MLIQSSVKMALGRDFNQFQPYGKKALVLSGIIAKISDRTFEQRTILLYVRDAHIMVRDTERPSLMFQIAN